MATGEPRGRIRRLAQIYALASPDEAPSGDAVEQHEDEASLGNDAGYPLCLAYAGLVVRTLAGEFAAELWLAQATRRELYFGFGCGDAIALGTIPDGGVLFHDT